MVAEVDQDQGQYIPGDPCDASGGADDNTMDIVDCSGWPGLELLLTTALADMGCVGRCCSSEDLLSNLLSPGPEATALPVSRLFLIRNATHCNSSM